MSNEVVHERTLPVVRSTPDAGLAVTGEKLTGYAVVYGVQTAGPVEIGGVYLPEIIDPGALEIRGNVPFTFQHRDFAEYGDTQSGTLTLTPDEKGIRFELQLPPYANVLREQIKSGAIKGMSFGFTAQALEVVDGVRHVQKGQLLHVSPVYSPAYPQTSVELKRAKASLDTKRKRLDLTEII